MQRCFVVLAGLVLLAAVIFTAMSGLATSSGQVYSVAQAYSEMLRHPLSWSGRTVLLRARAVPMVGTTCPSNNPWCSAILLTDDGDPTRLGSWLVATRGQDDSLLSYLRRLPFVGRLLPNMQSLEWGKTLIYRVRFEPEPFTPCLAPCLQTLVLDVHV